MPESLAEMLARHEGLVKHAYQDSEGYWTIGIGRLIDKRKGGGLTEEECFYLLKNDIQKVAQEAEQFSWYQSLNNPRKQVILNMLFNLGLGNFLKFKKMIEALQHGDFDEASKQMLDSKWATQVGKRATELSEVMKRGELVT